MGCAASQCAFGNPNAIPSAESTEERARKVVGQVLGDVHGAPRVDPSDDARPLHEEAFDCACAMPPRLPTTNHRRNPPASERRICANLRPCPKES